MTPPVNSHGQSCIEGQIDQDATPTPSIFKQCLDSTSATKVSSGAPSDQSSLRNEDEGPDPSWFKAATILLSLKTSAEARLMKGCQNGTSGFSPVWSPCNSPGNHIKNGATDIQGNRYHHGNGRDVSGTATQSNSYLPGNGYDVSGTDKSNSYHHGNGYDEEGELNWDGTNISHDNGFASHEENNEDYDEDDDDEIDRDLTTTCSLCHKVYSRPSTLKAHMRIHTGEKPFQCSICDKSFSQDANLKAHLRVHSKEKPFKCQICQRRFAQSSSVTTHMRIHSGERPYKCKVCSRGFADSSTLTKHLRIHTGEKPYQCKVCEMRFSQSGNLSRHMRVHRRKK